MKQPILVLFALLVGTAFGIGIVGVRAQTDIVEQANKLDTGMGWNVYFYITRPVNSFDEVVEVLPDHMAFIHEIERNDIMVMGGQTTRMGDSDAGGNGLVVIRASSFAEAKKIADQDPMHTSGVRDYELYEWAINEGELTIRLNMSDQSFTIR